jgi:hypothetical protein
MGLLRNRSQARKSRRRCSGCDGSSALVGVTSKVKPMVLARGYFPVNQLFSRLVRGHRCRLGRSGMQITFRQAHLLHASDAHSKLH